MPTTIITTSDPSLVESLVTNFPHCVVLASTQSKLIEFHVMPSGVK